MTIMGTGNESDFTLSLKALDRLLKILEDLDLPLTIRIFIGDGHHDAIGIYRYLKAKGIVPIIPLDEDSTPKTAKQDSATSLEGQQKQLKTEGDTEKTPNPQKTKKVSPKPQITMYPTIPFEHDGTPLCPGGCRMRHQGYNTAKSAHIFACPATRKNGTQHWVFHDQDCPFQQDCTPPEKKMGYTLYIKSKADLRLFPPITRDSKRFKALFAQRSGTERQNAVADSYHLDRRHRNAAYTLIRLTFVNICKHARSREAERHKHLSKQAGLHHTLARLRVSEFLPN
jgi:hypothetical protein